MINGKWAVITGASSGIGAEFAKLYSARGFSVVLAARREERLKKLAGELTTPSRIVVCDLSEIDGCKKLYESVKDLDVDLLINNAGFGAVGRFETIPLKDQLKMLDVNCRAVAALTHMFLNDFKQKRRGTILNVASSAGLLPGGPDMAMYYATKSFVVSLTSALAEEQRAMRSGVRIAALCPGPVDTEFNDVANVKFALKGITAAYCAKYAAYSLEKGEVIIVPEDKMKAAVFASRLVPRSLAVRVTAHQQRKKQ